MGESDPRANSSDDAPAATTTLSALAPVALRWWAGSEADPVQAEAESAAGLRALEACLEAEGGKQAALAPGRIEAKLDLILVMLSRVGDAMATGSTDDAHKPFLRCNALLRIGTIEWDDPMPPPDGTVVRLELRAAPGHPVSATFRAALAWKPGPEQADGSRRLVANLVPMAAPLRDSYERCLFILHRQSVRRSLAAPVPD